MFRELGVLTFGRVPCPGFKLNEHWAVAALQLFYDKFEEDGHFTIQVFMTDFCAPMLKGQMWEAGLRKAYYKQVPQLPAFERTVSLLKSERGRSKIMHLATHKLNRGFSFLAFQ